jgi:hypothetical protein
MKKALIFPAIRRLSVRSLYLLGIALTVVVFCAGGAVAQQTMELPIPGSQSSQPFVPRAQPTARPLTPRSNNVQTIPSAPPPAPPEEPPQAEEPPPRPPEAPAPEVRQPAPVLPAVFRGCWRGVVDETDQMQRLPGAPRLGLWMPKTYMLCYRRVGDGPFHLTFTAAGVQGTRITNTTGQLRLVSTDGRSFAKMRAYLHFDEYRAPEWLGLGNSTFAVDEVTDLDCTIEPDGMHASGVVYGEREGNPWFRAWWHTTFFHVSDLSG